MNFLNIGLPELIFFFALLLILLGPNQMQDNAKKLARLIRKVVQSESWRSFTGLYHEIKEYPSQIMKEVNLEEVTKDLDALNALAKKDMETLESEIRAVSADKSEAGKLSDEKK